MTDDFRALGKWKIQLTMKVKFMSSKKVVRVNQCILRVTTGKS